MEAHVSHVNEEENEDPGAALYGNFINYYSFNPPENRLSLIPETLLENIGLDERVLILDVGCNSGDLSVAFYKHVLHKEASGNDFPQREVYLLGFDLDQDFAAVSTCAPVLRSLCGCI
ncbi:hypothetical protein Q8A67_005650 [Cirrhinus molitorella]|uniref:RNA methyltransferase n=1 Tax=Cirrhinus molitorella TaxID=172907 RepID=A0AA88Q8K1_9TELE|nr:hypothetical protein Q8A67_005650 [Cirrhinus molitorella]